MEISYIKENHNELTIYDLEGKIINKIEKPEGKILTSGKDFFIIETETHYLFYNIQGEKLNQYPKEIGKFIKIANNECVFLEGEVLKKYNKNGFTTNSSTKLQQGNKTTKKTKVIEKLKKSASTFITILIIANAVAAGIMTYTEDNTEIEFWLNKFCDVSIIIFIIEILIRIFWNKKPKEFFTNEDKGWNIFDLVVTVISSFSFISGIEGIVGARALRILRELRLLRVASGISNMKKILQALLYSLPQISWASIFFILLYYIYGITGVELYGSCDEHFATLHRSFLTLLQLMTMDDWTNITLNVMETHPLAWIYFSTFILLASYILVNLIVGIVVDSLNEVHSQNQYDNNDELSREINKLEKQFDHVKEIIKKQELDKIKIEEEDNFE
ncbi:MAG: ion transporter [Bacteroidales bacterium]|nr:ion transporter [Bacteroidales bacterium]